MNQIMAKPLHCLSMRPLMLQRLFAVVVALVSASTVLADGKVFSTQAADLSSVPMPDQRALICFDGKVETLVIESGFLSPSPNATASGTPASGTTETKGETGGFAWVVPLPAQAEISESTPGLFPSLRALFAPRVETRTYREIAVAVLPLLLLVVLVILRVKSRWAYLILLMILCIIAAALLPTLGAARSAVGAAATADLTVLSRTRVGAREITQVSGSGDALRAWLTSNGVRVSPAVSRVVDDYAREGWVFAACKLLEPTTTTDTAVSPSSQNDSYSTSPLIFRFAARQPMYPMRLTGADAAVPLDVELFVFASGTASTPGLAARASAPTFVVSDPVDYHQPDSLGRVATRLELSHSGIVALTGGATHATHLRGELAPRDMTHDLEIDIGRASVFGRSVWTRDAAGENAILAGIAAAMVVLIVAAMAERIRSTRVVCTRRILLATLLLCLSVSGATFLAIPKLDGPLLGRENRSAMSELFKRLGDLKDTGPYTLQELVQRARTEAADISRESAVALREGDGPGEYRLARDQIGNACFVHVDAIGREHRHILLLVTLKDE